MFTQFFPCDDGITFSTLLVADPAALVNEQGQQLTCTALSFIAWPLWAAKGLTCSDLIEMGSVSQAENA